MGTGGLPSFPGINSGMMTIHSAFGQPVLPYGNANLNAQTRNRAFESAMGGPSRQQMMNSIRPDGSGLLRTAGDAQAINGQLAQRTAAGAGALTNVPYGQNLGNAQAMNQWRTGQGNDVVNQGQNLLGVANAYGDYNLASVLAQLDQQYGGAAAKTGILQNVLGGMMGQNGLFGGLLGGLGSLG